MLVKKHQCTDDYISLTSRSHAAGQHLGVKWIVAIVVTLMEYEWDISCVMMKACANISSSHLSSQYIREFRKTSLIIKT